MDRAFHSPWRFDSAPNSIAVFRALVLGDMLCVVPALRALRAAAPKARVTLIGLPWARQFAARFPQYLDSFLEFPGYPGLQEQPPSIDRLPAFLKEVQQIEFDLALQMHGSGTISNPLVALFGARQTAGFYLPGEYCPDVGQFLAYPAQEPEVWRHLRLLESLGIAPAGDAMEFPVYAEDRQSLANIPAAGRLPPGEYVCVHPGARSWSRRWKPEGFAAAADALARAGRPIAITGSASETELAAQVSRQMTMPHENLVGQTGLGALAALLDGARLLISNDTGVSHLAAALRVPSVVIVTGSDPQRWAPLDRRRHRVVTCAVGCRPCSHDLCPTGQPCSEGVSVDSVVRTAEELLERFAAGDVERRLRAPSPRDLRARPARSA